MAHLLIRHKVQDFTKWKNGFDSAVEYRKGGGEKSFHIFQTADDPDNVVILFEWDSLDNTRNFLGSEDLQKAMKEAGVAEKPDIYFLEEVAKGTP